MNCFHARGIAACLPVALLMSTALVKPSLAACTSSADFLTLTCNDTLAIGSGLPIQTYDAASAYQSSGGSKAYTPANPAFPPDSNPDNPGWDPNPPTVTVNFGGNAVANVVNPTSSQLWDKAAVLVANYPDVQNPAVNNVVVNNAGALAFSTNQISSTRIGLIVADSQVNNFTVNNFGTLSATQTFFSAFNAANLSAPSSGSPATNSAKYSGATLNVMTALYTDDNTNEFVLNNAGTGKALATGNFATAYYGRADATIANSGTIANTSWTSSDTIASGHWAIVAYAGTDYTPAPNTNPDSSIVLPNANGSVSIDQTSALTLTNNAGATIRGDIIALDITPQVYAAAVGASGNPFANPSQTSLLKLTVSSSNAGPRDSNIQNNGTINGNFYLGSGTHVIDNAAGASLNGSVYVDQRPVQANFTVPTPGTIPGTYVSAGGTDVNGAVCSDAGTNTTNPGCATTKSIVATAVGGQSLTLTNEGAFTGDIRLFDQSASNNSITLTGNGFNGNIVALNGWGQNSLTLNGDATLASVNNFSAINLNSSHLTVQANAATTTPGVTLVPNASIATTITGPGGAAGAPNSTHLGSIYGTLSLAGPTTVTPTFQTIIRNGDVYQLASAVTGAGASQVTVVGNGGALVTMSANAASGALLLDANVVNANTIAGLSRAGAATLNNLLSYGGPSAKVVGLGVAVESLPTLAGVRVAAEQLRPAVNGASIQLPLAVNTLFVGRIFDRVDADVYGALSGAVGPSDFLGSAGPVVKGPLSAALQEGAWFNAVGSSITQQTVSNVAGYNSTFGGFIAGYDHTLAPGLRLGGAVGYATGSARSNAPGESLTVQNVQGLVYGSLVQPTWYIKGAIGFGGLNYTSSRTVAFTGFYDYATGSRNGQLLTAGLDAGRPVATAYGTLIPVASLLYANINQDAYLEKSYAGAGLNVASQQTGSLQSGLGLKAVLPFAVAPSLNASLDLRAVWQHEFLDTAESVTAAFAGGSSFQAVGPLPARNLADLGAALRFGVPLQAMNFEISYNARLGANFAEQVGMFRARYDF